MSLNPVDERVAIVVRFAQGLVDASVVVTTMKDAAASGDLVAQSVASHISEAGPVRPVEPDAPSLLLSEPKAYTRKNVLHPIECAYLVAKSSAGLVPSSVLTKEGSKVDADFRRSMNRALDEQGLDDAERVILDKAADRAGVARGLRDRNIVGYSQGDIFKAHFDPIVPSEHNPHGVRRSHTNIIYLNETYSGGETAFIKAGVAFKGMTGELLQFCNELPDGSRDEAALHAGLPINSGQKWILVQWRS